MRHILQKTFVERRKALFHLMVSGSLTRGAASGQAGFDKLCMR